MKTVLAVMLLGVAFFAGCATPVISEKTRSLVDSRLTFAQLKQNPEAFVGKYVMLGGVIAGVKNTKEGSQLEIMQVKLDDSGMPEDVFHTEGRFLALSHDFLDGMIYKPGRLVTLVGEVNGKKVQPLDEVDYTYPVLMIKEIHIWKRYENENGYPYPVPGPYYNYDPYYYGYWPGPYWYRPLGPIYRRW